MNNDKIMKASIGNYFSPPVIVVGSVLVTAAIGCLILWLHGYIMDSAISFGKSLLELLTQWMPLILPLTLAGLFLIFTQRVILFNTESKELLDGWKFFRWTHGQWKSFEPNCSHFAFQRYQQTHKFSYGGLYEREVDEYVYDLRMIFPDQTFQSIASATDFQAVTQIILLGRKMSEVYNLPFYDYVRELLKKQQVG